MGGAGSKTIGAPEVVPIPPAEQRGLNEIEEWLVVKLQINNADAIAYAAQMKLLGVDILDDVFSLQAVDLDAMTMKPIHRRKIADLLIQEAVSSQEEGKKMALSRAEEKVEMIQAEGTILDAQRVQYPIATEKIEPNGGFSTIGNSVGRAPKAEAKKDLRFLPPVPPAPTSPSYEKMEPKSTRRTMGSSTVGMAKAEAKEGVLLSHPVPAASKSSSSSASPLSTALPGFDSDALLLPDETAKQQPKCNQKQMRTKRARGRNDRSNHPRVVNRGVSREDIESMEPVKIVIDDWRGYPSFAQIHEAKGEAGSDISRVPHPSIPVRQGSRSV